MRFTLMLIICSSGPDDIGPALAACGIAFRHETDPRAALASAGPGDALALLAPQYPAADDAAQQAWTRTARAALEQAAALGLRVYVEFTPQVPGVDLAAEPRFIAVGPYGSILERVVLAGDGFAPELPRLALMGFSDCHYLPVENPEGIGAVHLALARVVGFRRAELGLPRETQPLLFEHATQPWLVATTALSRCVTARCAPAAAWRAVWRGILRWLGVDAEAAAALTWQSTVRPAYNEREALPPEARRAALQHAGTWIERSRLLIAAGEADAVSGARQQALDPARVPGDGAHGIMESYTSKRIFADGRHSVGPSNRPDCTAQAAAVAALHARLFGTENSGDSAGIARRLMDFTFAGPALRSGAYDDPATALYGLLPFDTISTELSFSDDNARAILGGIAAGVLLGDARWDRALLRCILANLRTTGTQGFRPNKCAARTQLLAEGWRPTWEFGGIDPSAHFHTWIWACYLWLYDKTGYAPLLERSRAGIAALMATGPEGWTAEGGRREEEIAHLLLPVAWLLRVDDHPERHAENRDWADALFGMIDNLLAPCGALAQWPVNQSSTEIDPAERRTLPHPAPSNDCYGIEEGPIVYQFGDTGTDLLYSFNFALAGLTELAAATGEAKHAQALERMLDFATRTQTRSTRHDELDGTWYRGFDYGLWEYWGSDTDWGYGVMTAEVGWTHSLITLALGLREMQTNLWDLTRASGVPREFEAEREALGLPALAAEVR
jgi:hypothetical protein